MCHPCDIDCQKLSVFASFFPSSVPRQKKGSLLYMLYNPSNNNTNQQLIKANVTAILGINLKLEAFKKNIAAGIDNPAFNHQPLL